MCVRIDSYESQEAQDLVRSYLNGRFENTAFCILSPDGTQRLTRSGRGPQHAIRGDLAEGLERIARRYSPKQKAQEAAVPDFPNFRLGLNVASADQRLILLVSGTNQELKKTREVLKAVCNDPDLIGRFHYDFEEQKQSWQKVLTGPSDQSRLMLILPDEFGQKGKVLWSMPLDTPSAEIKSGLLESNRAFANEVEKKVYREHVRKGRREKIQWTMPMEYGEDRDGDGEIDFRGPPRRR